MGNSPARATSLVTREVAGECIIVQVRGGVADLDSIYTLNDTATWIWNRLDGRLTERQLAAALVEAFDVDPTTAEADVAEIIDELCVEGLASRTNANPTEAAIQADRPR